MLKEFAPDKNVFIDASMESLGGIYTDDIVCERYDVKDFDLSIINLNLALANNKVLIDKLCKLTRSDLESFKYDNNNNGKDRSNRDGFVACIRTAMIYYGGIN